MTFSDVASWQVGPFVVDVSTGAEQMKAYDPVVIMNLGSSNNPLSEECKQKGKEHVVKRQP